MINAKMVKNSWSCRHRSRYGSNTANRLGERKENGRENR